MQLLYRQNPISLDQLDKLFKHVFQNSEFSSLNTSGTIPTIAIACLPLIYVVKK
ncbi:hypothetical protein HanRHA438_Chr14g0630331 [Helianthus annuus]|nr:hypothetical protein HanRHA438_Chr14g0630331 [Helianthus annuus]